jgi:hypothetical protein
LNFVCRKTAQARNREDAALGTPPADDQTP